MLHPNEAETRINQAVSILEETPGQPEERSDLSVPLNLESSLCCHPLFVAVSVFGLDSLKLTYLLRGHEKLWKTTDLALVSQAFDCKKFAHRQTVYQSSVIPFTFYQLLQKRVPCIIFHTAPSVSTSLFSSKVAFCAVHFSLTNV